MKYLTEKYWDYFFKTIVCRGKEKTIHDGKHFEELTLALLEKLYQNEGITWSPTQETHDGNRDFYAQNLMGEILWAECKNYHKSIELKNIAATIVMVQLNNVSEILFFSYSPINKNTKKKLTIYANQNDKKIFFYDDVNLENLIFNYRESIIPCFFKGFCYTPDMQLDYAPHIFTKYGNGIIVSTTETKACEVIYSQLNDIIYIGIGIFNRNPRQILHIKLAIGKEYDLEYFELLDIHYNREKIPDYEINATLMPLEAGFYTIFFRISVYKETLKLPNLILHYTTEDSSSKYELSTATIKVDHMFLTGLMGAPYYNLLSEFENKFFTVCSLKAVYLRGKSGVGKTRMLYEYTNILLKQKYQIITFTSVSQEMSSIYVIKEIIYKLYNLSEELIIESLKNPISHENILGDEMPMIIEMLQNIVQSNLNAIEQYKTLIFEKIIKTQVAIIVDNIQYFDEILIDFLNSYCLYAQNVNRPNRSIIIITQNIDYYESPKLNELTLVLKALSENNFMKVSIEEVKGFDAKQALGFFKAVVAFEDGTLNDILLQIVEKANNNPQLILETAKYLRQKDIIKTENDCLLIKNYSYFKTELKDFPLENDNIIERRWKIYIKKKSDKKNIMILLSAVHFFQKITRHLCKEIKIDPDCLDELCKAGFLKRNTHNEFTFEHDIIESFFMKEHDFSFLIIDYLLKIEYATINIRTWQKNLLDIKKQQISVCELEVLLNCFCNMNLIVPYKWQIIYYDAIINFFLLNYDNINNKKLLIYGFHHTCINIKNTFGTEVAIQIYNIIYDTLERKMGNERYQCIQYLEFLDGYTENMLHSGIDDVISIYHKEINELEKYPDLFPNILGKLYNRIYVFYKDKVKEQHVHGYYLKCDQICQKHNLYELQMLNYFDAGTYNLYQNYDKDKLISFWSKAFEIYIREEFDDAFLFVKRKKIQLHFLTQQFDLIEQELKEAQNYLDLFHSNIQQSLYFYKNFSVLYVTYLLISNTNYKDLPWHLSKALDYSEQMNKSVMYNIYFLYAKYYYLINDIPNMIIYYEMSLNAIEEKKNYIYYDVFKKIIYDDFSFKVASLLLSKNEIDESMCKNGISIEIYNKFNNYTLKMLENYIGLFRTVSVIASYNYKDGYIPI